MSKALYKFEADWCYGVLSGLFIEDEDRVAQAMGENIYFGEVLGKHSEVEDELKESELTKISDDPEFIKSIVSVMGDGVILGYNPIEIYFDRLNDI